MANRKVRVKQIRSSNRHPQDQLQTLRCLGLGKINREIEHELSDCVRGMLVKVAHLVEVRSIEKVQR